MKELAAYNLVVAKGGLKLKDSIDTTAQSKQTGIAKSTNTDDAPAGGGIRVNGQPGGRLLRGNAVLLSDLAGFQLSETTGAPVIDKTGLTGMYDFRIEFSTAATPVDSAQFPSIFTALEKDLGLKLESTKASFDMLVIDHIDSAPAEN